MLLRGEDRELRHHGSYRYKNLSHESGVRRAVRRRLHRLERRLARLTPVDAMLIYAEAFVYEEREIDRDHEEFAMMKLLAAETARDVELDNWLEYQGIGTGYDDYEPYDWRDDAPWLD
jgi:hypothetical protein